jgi:hypothetical protein
MASQLARRIRIVMLMVPVWLSPVFGKEAPGLRPLDQREQEQRGSGNCPQEIAYECGTLHKRMCTLPHSFVSGGVRNGVSMADGVSKAEVR